MRSSRLRVTGGELRGRRFRSPGAVDVRPTSDRIREALFMRLGSFEGTRVLDLYAGSGALGIEALSRGADFVVFVERSRRTVSVLRRNLQELALEERSRIVVCEAATALARLARGGERFQTIFLDPPYASDEVGRALRGVSASGLLARSGRILVETRWPVEASRLGLPPPDLALRDERRYGDTCLLWFEAPDPGQDEGGPPEP